MTRRGLFALLAAAVAAPAIAEVLPPPEPQVPFGFSDAELALLFDEFRDRYLTPAAEAIAKCMWAQADAYLAGISVSDHIGAEEYEDEEDEW